MVVELLKILLKTVPPTNRYRYIVYLNNLFMSYKLALYLREKVGVSVIRTTRTNSSMFKKFVKLKTKDKKKDRVP